MRACAVGELSYEACAKVTVSLQSAHTLDWLLSREPERRTSFHGRMFLFLIFASLCASGLSAPLMDTYSFSLPVGSGSGTSFVLEGDEAITAVRVWERDSSYIYAIQLRFGYIWSKVAGRVSGTMHELQLFPGERLIQVSGKFQRSSIYQVHFGTSMGRSLIAGQPTSTSFNMYAAHPSAELRKLSGRYDWSITSLAAHWGEVKSTTRL